MMTVMLIFLLLCKSHSLNSNVCHCFIIYEETGVKAESVDIHLMMTRGMTMLKVMTRMVGTRGCLGMTVTQRMVVLAFRRALIIIMVYL